ncbi:MAG: tetraacyldisaccharide 4'-kinase [Vicinamibacterales bacterium]
MLDHLYALAARARRRRFERRPGERRRLARPVISVGNLSVGGTGKTPLVIAITRALLAAGERPAVLSRGYGRAVAREGVVAVADRAGIRAGLDESGDEPLLIARAAPGAIVCVAEDRWLAGVLAERRLGATVHVLDDGFQHTRLARDLDILVTSPGEIAGGRVLPAGRLREGADAAARADLLVVVGAGVEAARQEAWTLGVHEAVGAARVPGAARMLDAGGGDPEALRRSGAPAVAVAGIAHPARFFEELRAAGWTIARELVFRDHHRFGAADLRRIGAAATGAGAALVITTEKDAIRLAAAGPLPCPVAAAPMTMACEPEGALMAAVDEAIARARAAAAAVAPWPPLAPVRAVVEAAG